MSAMRRMGLRFSLVCLAIYSLSFSAFSSSTESLDLDALTNTIHEFVNEQLQDKYHGNLEINVNKIDRRLKLKNCTSPLEFTLPQANRLKSRTTVKVKCYEPQYWSILVPVMITLSQPVVITTRTISRHSTIDANDIALSEVNINALGQSYFTDLNSVIGKYVKQPIRAGSIIKPDSLAEPLIIKRGELVRIQAAQNDFSVSMQGKALEDATQGELIRVQNIHSKRIVEAVATAPGKVQIRL